MFLGKGKFTKSKTSPWPWKSMVDWLWLIQKGDPFIMLQEKRLKPWTVVRSLPNLEKVVLGEFRSWSDADGHLQILKRMVPADSLSVVFLPTVQG
jgi:hypothetical protein